MEVYYAVVFFIFGIVFGSFYNVVGYRLPLHQSLISPPSHCTNCGHTLKAYELIPIFSWLFLGRKCLKCKQKISWFYPVFELSTGILFLVSYLIFGFSFKLLLVLTIISLLLIIIISDYQTLTIPDEIIIFGLAILSIEIFLLNSFNGTFNASNGFNGLMNAYFNGIVSFGIMYLLKLFGDLVFKKESMGGGDIKLMFLIGMVLGWKEAIIVLFLSAFIALPISIGILITKKDHVLPFGPFLSVATIILLLTNFNLQSFLNIFTI